MGQGAFGGTLVSIAESSGTGNTASQTCVYWKRSTGSEDTVSATGGSSWMLGIQLAYRGCIEWGDPTVLLDTNFNNTPEFDITTPSITTTIDGCMAVVTTSNGDNRIILSDAWTASGGSPVNRHNEATSVGTDGALSGCDMLMATAGATGTFGGTRLQEEEQANIIFALLPEGALPVAPAVLSVEKFSLAMSGATVSTPALSLGQDIDNCVPFITVSANIEENYRQLIDVVKNGGTNKFDLSVGDGGGTRNVEVTIVEFDPAEVTVQEVSFTITSSNTVDVTLSAIVEASTFPIIYYKTVEATDDFHRALIKATFDSTTNLVISCTAWSGNKTGHAYILEALKGAWAIEAGASIPFAYTTSQATKNSAITVTPSRTGVWSYWDTDENSDDVRDGIWDAAITDATNLDLTRGDGTTPSATGDIEVFVVNFAAEVASVQQGAFDYGTSVTKTAAISAPSELDNTMIVATSAFGWCEGNSIVNGARHGALGRMTFNSSTEVLGDRQYVGVGNYHQNFQVIEWLIASVGDADEPIIIMLGF